MKTPFKSGRKLSAFAMIFVLLVVMVINWDTAPWKEGSHVIKSDVNSYYAYLPAVFVYHDITLKFFDKNWKSLGPDFYPKRSSTWGHVILTTYGMSVLYFPFFITAHILAPTLGYSATGFSLPYQFAIQMSSWFYLLLGLFFLRKLLLKYFADKVVAIVLVAITLCTNLLWYVTGEAGMSHVYSFFLINLFFFLMDSWLEKISFWKTIFLGLLVGFISLVRPTNIIVGILVILWKVTSLDDLKKRVFWLFSQWKLILLMILMVFLSWLPQFLYWKLVAGTYVYYSYPDEQGFYFNNPQFFNLFFSWRKGWLIYTPVMAFSIIGIVMLGKLKRQFFWAVLIYFLVSWYVVSSWWCWWYGGGLGIRAFVESYGIFAFGLAAFLTWAFKQHIWHKILILIPFVFSLWNGSHNVARYFNDSLHFDGNTKQTYLEGFFKIEPNENYWFTIKRPDYDLARKGIYRYEWEVENDKEEKPE